MSVYGDDLVEGKETFKKMMEVYPYGCIGAFTGDQLAGYKFFHPYPENRVKALDSALEFNGEEDCMYLHDVTVRRKHQGTGLSGVLIEKFNRDTVNKGFKVQCLLSVQSSRSFWERKGFKKLEKIMGYGMGDAYYMKRHL